MKPQKLNLKKSINHLKRAKKVIPLAAQTFSKCYTQFSVGAVPLFLTHGKGAYVWDLDGHKYIDYEMALCPVILGYDYPEVSKAAISQVKKGVSLSLSHPLEVKLAEKICSIYPSIEMVRFGKNGSDVTSAAVRLARAYTGREIIISTGYHGWHDWYIGTTSRDKGVPKSTKKMTKTFKYNDIKSLEKIFEKYPNKVAGVILEPMGLEWPKDNFLEKVKEITHKNGALLIFDEIITGFRLALGGGQQYFKVSPDLTCLGKAIANGFPISVIGGRKEIMKELEDVFFSFTFGGELVSIKAALATIGVLEKEPVIKYISDLGYQLQDAYNQIAKEINLSEFTKAIGYGARHIIKFTKAKDEEDLAAKAVFQQELAKRGILFGGGNSLSYSHSKQDIQETIRAFREALKIIKAGLENDNLESLMEGEKLEPVFRKP